MACADASPNVWRGVSITMTRSHPSQTDSQSPDIVYPRATHARTQKHIVEPRAKHTGTRFHSHFFMRMQFKISEQDAGLGVFSLMCSTNFESNPSYYLW